MEKAIIEGGGCSATWGRCNRSTRGASKQRRDQINGELQQLRHLLPVAVPAKERLFQLQVMALCCVWIRKHALLSAVLPPDPSSDQSSDGLISSLQMDRLLHDRFILVITEQGKLLSLGDNFHSDPSFCTEEFIAQGDCIQELIDPRDHSALAQAMIDARESERKTAFVCRWRAPKIGASKRQTDWDGRPTVVEGKFIDGTLGGKHPRVFAALCRPLRTTSVDQQSGLMIADPSLFRLWLSPSLHIVQLCSNAKHHLGPFLIRDFWPSSSPTVALQPIQFPSLYQLVHPQCVLALSQLHHKLLNCRRHAVVGGAHLRPLFLRVTNAIGIESLQLHSVFSLKGKLIEGIFQVLSDLEAEVVPNAKWLYEGQKMVDRHGGDAATVEGKKANKLTNVPKQQMNDHYKLSMSSQLPVVPQPLRMASCRNCIGSGTLFRIGCHKPTTETEPDVNNNSVAMMVGTPSATPFYTSAAGEDDHNGIFHQLPTLCDGGQLPELDDRDLDEFFRQVEGSSGADPQIDLMGKKRKRKLIDEQQQESAMLGTSFGEEDILLSGI